MTSLLPLTTDIIRAFGWTLLHSFWQAFCVYACLRVVLKIWPMASAAIKYHLSFLSLAGISGWFVWTFFHELSLVKAEHVVEELAMKMDVSTLAAVAQHVPAQKTDGLHMMLPGMEVYFPVLVSIYAIGVVIMAIKLCIDLAQLRQIRQQDVTAMGKEWEHHLFRLASRMGVARKVQLFISKHLQVPVMIGFLRPVILLPAAMVNNLSPDQLEAILLHELAHIKRNDYLLNIFQSIVETILFFNPFVWWISKNIRLEREHCCDDLVIAGTVQPLQYARALVALEEYRLTANPMAMAAADDKHHLLHRIKRIMEMKKKNLNYTQRMMAMLIILTGLVSIAWLNPSANTAKAETFFSWNRDTVPVPPPAPPAPPPVTATAAPVAPIAPVTPPAPPAPGTPVSPVAPPAPPAPPTPPDFIYDFDNDTLPAKNRKIIITNDKGEVKEYNSIDEMPAGDRKKMEESYIRMQQAQQRARDAQARMKNFNWDKMNQQIAESMKNIDWEKINRNVTESMKNINWDKMNQQLAESMKKIDWDKMNRDIEKSMKNIDWDKMNRNIQEQMKNIQWDKIQDQLKDKMNKADWEKMQQDIKKSLDKINWEEINAARTEALRDMNQARAHDMRARQEALKAAHQESMEALRARQQALQLARAEALKAQQQQFRAVAEARNAYLRSGQAARAEKHSRNMNDLLKGLENDKLIDRSENFDIQKKDGHLYINGKKQPAKVMRKYSQYLKEDNVSISGNKTNLHINVQDQD
ncbi:M56 family metallopeptidase [Chitinophaga cymbidii]|uniref:M56 family metallopeptidase n=1 Tax=Chitinophaga cymbidii TaxID=1096750 RepID=UPI0011BDFB58|nr:M56 family metallopeptidase [Chitinophaga cymbidii]